MRRLFAVLAVLLPLSSAAPVLASGSAASTPILPPVQPWDGASRNLMADDDDPWITPAEKDGLESSPSYDETMAWLERLTAAAPELEMMPFGTSGEGRTLWLVVASSDRAFTPQAVARTGKAVLLAQAGIHPGEIDGKDAGLMLLRDMTVGGSKRHLLDKAVFLFVPIFNVDGHERSSPHGRINQRGPREMGWRTNARNLNFNRDYTKADTPGMRAMLQLLNTWEIDLYVDLHVTDGVDYQYDITWGAHGPHTYSPSISHWLRGVLDPKLIADLEAMGHIPGPLIFTLSPTFDAGLFAWTGGPRFSDGYGSARHLPTILVENHSLKPYPQRVLGTYALLESLLTHLGKETASLRAAIAKDKARRRDEVPLTWKPGERSTVELKAIEARVETSTISGGEKVVWTGKPVVQEVEVVALNVVDKTASRPSAYWIPPAWSDIADLLELHGLELERTSTARELEVEMYRIEDAVLEDAPFEGHIRVKEAKAVVETRREHFPAGSVRVSTDQPLGELAVLLLEPDSPDSFFQWGFFLEILQRTEYVEGYVMDPMAERMLAEDPELKRAFEAKLAADEDFAGNPRARLQWFYEKTPFFDEQWRLYPVAREP